MRHCLVLFGWCCALAGTSADEPLVKKFLLVGIDGFRTDALLEAPAPHLHALIDKGAFSKSNDVIGDRKSGADTLSGPGWTSILSGVWADKHGILDNGPFTSRYATFFGRIRAANPKATVGIFVTWKQMSDRIFAPGEGAQLVTNGPTTGFEKADQLVADATVKSLAEGDPTAVFAFFGQVDAMGHQHGFHPKSGKYVQAIVGVDAHVGKIVAATTARRTFAKEDWLIVVATDHGGRGTGHSAGRSHEEVRWTFLILHGPSVVPGAIREKTANVDIAVTALTHLGAKIDPQWKLDGRCVGLKVP